MTSNEPEAIRQDIERTRQSLSDDVDTLNQKVNPSFVVQRQRQALHGRFTQAKDRVMGGGPSPSGSDSAPSAMGTLQDRAASAPGAVTAQTQGNPLAAGLIAFGVGWLTSSLLPTTQAEQQAARQLQERASDLAEPAKAMAQDAASQLQGSAQQAVESVRSTAQDAAQEVKGDAQQAKDDVQGQAQSSAQSVREQGSSG